MNQTDTTTGYVLGDLQMQNIPLGTGSFTQMAILSPGVSADLLNTSGTNAGLGNQSIWANGERDTSNSFSMNGVTATNIFNGKSSSQVTSSRVAVNIGESGNGTNNPSGSIVTSTSVYGAIGQSLPSPPVETIQEMRVNSAMYDASQGSNSGAHIEVTTKSGTNAIHGGAYEYFQTTDFDANPWFFNYNGLPRPSLNRNVYGGFLGGPIKKDKAFYFVSYQGQRVFDQLLGTSYAAVPPGLTDQRDATTIAALANVDFKKDGCGGSNPACLNIQPNQITPQALAILNLKTKSGSFFIPNAETDPAILSNLQSLGADAIVNGPGSQFLAHQMNANVDYNFNPQDRLSAKYYFQQAPNTTPFANSTLLGFPQTMNAGSQSFSLDNTRILTPNLSWEQRLGFVRERAFAVTSGEFTAADAQLALPGLTAFPQMNIHRADGIGQGSNNYTLGNELGIGPINNFANAGMFQNNFEFASNLNWVHGRHTISTGFIWDYTQLNVINKNNEVSRVTFEDFPGFLLGNVCGPNTTYCSGQDTSQILNGASNRYFRASQVGAYVQDDFKLRSNLSLNLGARWDWDGPLNEKNGYLTNFYPQDYSYDAASDTIQSIGLVVAGNNKAFGTKGVSASTITGRQWGFAPRIGLVYSPSFLKNFVIRSGFGMYYDRGEYFTELSSPAGGGISGPFGVTVAEPFVVPFSAVSGGGFASPFGSSVPAPPSNLAGVAALIPNAADLINNTTPYCDATGQFGCGPLLFGGYDPQNKLPYSENWTLDAQWQPINSVVLSLGYIGNHGVHQVIPLPFNQAVIATPQNPVLSGGPNEQIYSYGYNVPGVAAESISTNVAGYGTGNAALRAPYLGYDPNSNYNEAIGESNYNALQFEVTKHFTRGLMVTGSYTYSHTLDEQSGLGLFFTGNDPSNVHSSYGNSDYDRTHVFVASYMYQFPTMDNPTSFEKWAVNGWGLNGVTVLQSGQPYSVNDYSGGAASIYYGGGQDEVTNPIVPVGGVGSSASNPRLQGTTGINANNPVLNAAAFGVPAPFAPGTNGVPPCDPTSGACDNYETGYAVGGRNIFRGPFQNRFDFGVFKNFQVTERLAARLDIQAFNIFNHPSFDIPNNNVNFNPYYNNPPIYGAGTGYTACVPATGAYACPPSGHLGQIQHTIGSPRFLQLGVHFTF
ncbi:MAG: TonB-dependent receptor domain-containing protein [Candidatus Acidiferrales bacterium]